MRALIVDDSRAMRRILAGMLREAGFETFEAGDGKEALAVLETEGAVELALVDWNMPVMNGFEFLCAARAEADYSSMRIMMVTTETGVEEMTKALESGADEYVMKPFTKDDIVEKIKMLGL